MKSLKLIVPAAVLVFTASFGYAQNMILSKAEVDSIKLVPFNEPFVYLGNGLSSGKIAKENLLENPFVTAKASNSEIEWGVVSYDVTFVVNGKEEAPIRVTGAQFPEAVKTRIQSATTGTIVEFNNVLIHSIAGKRTIVRPIVVRIR